MAAPVAHRHVADEDPASLSGADADTCRAELRRLPMQAIDDLPPTFHEIVNLRDVHGRSNVEAA